MTDPELDPISRNAKATEDLVLALNDRYRTLRRGLRATFAGLVLLGVLFAGLTSWVVWRVNLNARQEQCAWAVQGHYIKQIGLLADSNGAQLRGEPADPARNRDRVVELRKASEYVNQIHAICFTSAPDDTPLDGRLPDGTVVVPS